MKILNKLFESREVTHVMHLSSKSYANHKALETYYEGIVDLIDLLAEAYQGQYGLIKDYTFIKDKPSDMNDAVKYLENIVNYILDNRYKEYKEKDAHLQAIIDEIINLQFRTIYKLKYLK